MKAINNIMRYLTWAAWVVFVASIATLEKPTAFNCFGVVMAGAWLATMAFLKEELGGDCR